MHIHNAQIEGNGPNHVVSLSSKLLSLYPFLNASSKDTFLRVSDLSQVSSWQSLLLLGNGAVETWIYLVPQNCYYRIIFIKSSISSFNKSKSWFSTDVCFMPVWGGLCMNANLSPSSITDKTNWLSAFFTSFVRKIWDGLPQVSLETADLYLHWSHFLLLKGIQNNWMVLWDSSLCSHISFHH